MKPVSIDCRRASDLLGTFADGALDPELAAAVSGHAAECEACGRELAATRHLLAELRGLAPVRERPEASWGDFSRAVRLSYERSAAEDRARTLSLALPRRLWRLLFGAGAALALGTASLVVVQRQQATRAAVLSIAPAPAQDAPANADHVVRAPAPLPDQEAARLEAAGRLGDLLGDADPDELLDELDDEQLERVGKALTPGA